MELQISIPKYDSRSVDEIMEHYALEKLLAAQLRNSQKHGRGRLYTELYDKLYKNIPHHTQISRKKNLEISRREVDCKMRLVKPFLTADTVFLEVGPGDCHFSFEVAKFVRKVYAVDVSREITKNSQLPTNFELSISDGCSIPVAENHISVAYSNQLMEHLHPEDSYEQLMEIYAALRPGGVYICITPNRLAGPHDISKYFDTVATGFHLKEYTNRDVHDLLRQVGFSKVITYMGGKGVYYRFPYLLTLLVEGLLSRLPFYLRYRLANFLPVRAILGVIMVAQK
jgi:SAM-dependent methyltransferase